MKNLGLSLTDTYWICPARLDLTWDEVNLFDNGNKELKFHDGYGKVHYTNDKDAALIGSLFKYANFIDNEWYMIKFGNAKYPNGIQNVNEKFASIVHHSQGFKEYVPYITMSKNIGDNDICKCRIVSAAVIRMNHENRIEQIRFTVGEGPIKPQHVENIFGDRVLLLRIMNDQRVSVHVMPLGMVGVTAKCREFRDQVNSFEERVIYIRRVGVFIKVVKRQRQHLQPVHEIDRF